MSSHRAPDSEVTLLNTCRTKRCIFRERGDPRPEEADTNMKTNRAERWYTVTDEKAGSAGAHTNTNNALLIHSAGGANKACIV